MKKIIFIAATALVMLVSCKNDSSTTQQIALNDYVTFSGKITDKNSDSVVIRSKEFSKTIEVAADGSFSDTLKVAPGFYTLFDGGEYSQLYLKNGYDLEMSLDTKKFDESISYKGEGAENNNFLVEKTVLEMSLFDIEVDGMNKETLQEQLSQIETKMMEFVDSKKNLDTAVVNKTRSGIKGSIESYGGYLGDLIALRANLPKGAPSPVFSNYENHAGGKTSLKDLKGKYVYIDVWATWCGPCKAEIPFLKEVEADYHNKNIEFVSVSIDRPKDHDKWVFMVKDKELGGVQLFADNNWESKFVKDYFINGIPRFILIDPNGKIVTPDAPRPSDPKLRSMLDEMI